MAAVFTDSNFDTEVLKADKLSVIDFWAPWCMPCRMMAPVLIDLSEDPEFKDKLAVLKMNTEEGDNGHLAQMLQIQSIPNMKLFYQGKIVIYEILKKH